MAALRKVVLKTSGALINSGALCRLNARLTAKTIQLSIEHVEPSADSAIIWPDWTARAPRQYSDSTQSARDIWRAWAARRLDRGDEYRFCAELELDEADFLALRRWRNRHNEG